MALLGWAGAAWPLSARAQQPLPLVGFAIGGAPGPLRPQIAAFHDELKKSGYVDAVNVKVELRFAEGRFERMPGLLADLLQRRVSVLAVSSVSGARSAKEATATVPIVFTVGGDPVEAGLVASLNRPGGNMTGTYQFTIGLEAKRLGLLHEMVPKAKAIGVLTNPSFSGTAAGLRDIQEAAIRLGVRLVIGRADAENDFAAAFSAMVDGGAEALQVLASPYFYGRREQLVVLSARHSLPAMYEWREFAIAGGLMSYGTILADAYRQVGTYVGRILKGAKPADLPVVQSIRFEFVINLNTAKALGIEVPPTLSARAEEVIE